MIPDSIDLQTPATDWHAIPVRVSAEKAVAQSLANRGMEVFSPTYTTRRLWSDRTADIELPLFPGFIFCALPPLFQHSSLSVEGVVGINSPPKRLPIPANAREIESIRKLTSLELSLTPWPYLSQVPAVEIVDGRLRGVAGVLIAPGKLVVSLTALQRSILVDLSTEPIAVATFAGVR